MYIKNIKRIEKSIVASIVMSSLMLFAVSMNVSANDISVESVWRELNGARTSFGLNLLVKNEQLSAAAQAKLDDMLAKGYFEHTSPTGVRPWDWMNKSGYAYTIAGENLAMDFKTVQAQQEAWMESPTHRKNILNGDFQEAGIAVGQGVVNGRLTTIVVQEFGARKDFASLPQNENGAEAKLSEGKVLGVQNFKLTTWVSKINSALALGAISGWTMIMFVAAMSLMCVAAIYLTFDIHRIHRDMRLAKELHHQSVYSIEDDYVHIFNKFSSEIRKLKNHRS